MESALIIKILYSAAAIQGLFLAALLVRSKTNRSANRILSILLCLLSFHLVLVAFDERSFFMALPHLSRISWIIGSLYWPLLFLFVQAIMKYPLPRWVNVLLFVPFFVALALMLPYYLQSAEQKRAILDNFGKASLADFGVINQVISVLHIVFQGLCLAFYFHIEEKLKDEYSALESLRIKWLRQFLIGILIVTVIAVFSFFARNFEIPVLSSLYSFHFFGLVILFYWLSYRALTSPVVFGLEPVMQVNEVVKTSSKEIPDDKLQASFEQISRVLKEDRLFTKATLTLSELADKAGVARHLASQAINTQTDGNFFDLVNNLRVEEFKRIVTDPSKKNLNLVGIAQEAGFNSKASFYAIFKKNTGMTPSQYAEKQSEPVK